MLVIHLEDNLKKNDKFDWQFVSREKADHEIKMGKYYAGIYIPKEFSHQITGTLRKKPQKPISNIKLIKNQCRRTENDLIQGQRSSLTKQINSSTKPSRKRYYKEANKVGIQLEEKYLTINKIKMQFMRHMTHYHKSIKLRIVLNI